MAPAAGRSAARPGLRAVRRWRTHLAIMCALGAFAPLGESMAQTSPSFDVKAWVLRSDKNGDGMIDRGEFHAAVTEGFFFRDKNKSGYLTIEELKEASPEALKAVKRKASGQITLQEYVNALFRDFEVADANQDGLLTVEEIKIYIRTTK